jgi:hypothetical protein
VARKFIILFGAVSLTACGQSTDNQAANQAAANAAQPKKIAAYCFF